MQLTSDPMLGAASMWGAMRIPNLKRIFESLELDQETPRQAKRIRR